MSEPSATDMLMDALGDSMLSLPPAMLMDEESAREICDASRSSSSNDNDRAVSIVDSPHTVIPSVDKPVAVANDVSAGPNVGGNMTIEDEDGNSTQLMPFDLTSSFFNPISFGGDELAMHHLSEIESQSQHQPQEEQQEQHDLAASTSALLQQLQHEEHGHQHPHEDIIDDDSFHTDGFLLNGFNVPPSSPPFAHAIADSM
jgi:hypothetical protein